MAKYNLKEAKVNEDGSITQLDGVIIPATTLGIGLLKARVNRTSVNRKPKLTIKEHKENISKYKKFTIKWFKSVFGAEGFIIGKKAITTISSVFNEISIKDLLNYLRKNKFKIVTSDSILISIGKETESTKKKLSIIKKREERLLLLKENKEKKFQEKKEKLQKSIDAKTLKLNLMKKEIEDKLENLSK